MAYDKQNKEISHETETIAKRTLHWSDHHYNTRPRSHSSSEIAGIAPDASKAITSSSVSVGVNKEVIEEPVWMEANTARKRLRHSPEEGTSKHLKAKQTKIDYWLDPTTSNRYSLLDTDSGLTQETSSEFSEMPVEKIKKPPPVFVAGVGNINPLYQLLNEIAAGGYTLRVINHTEVKIQANTMELYDAIVSALKSKNTEFHSYQKKQDKPFKVVLKNMHSSSDLNLLKSELKELGHDAINISNIRHRVTKNPLLMFYVELKSNVNNKDIYKIVHLLNSRIYFEPPNRKREIPQCTRCQRYGHTKNFCARQPRCVKCAGNHQTVECSRKGTSQNVKCVLCEGNHPANYKGCQVYKELQNSKYPALRKKNTPAGPSFGNSGHLLSTTGQTYPKRCDVRTALNQRYTIDATDATYRQLNITTKQWTNSSSFQ